MEDHRDNHPKNSKRRVLVVDDDPDFAFEMQAVLRKDCDVFLSRGSCEALTLLQTLSVDIAVVDVDLPPFLGPFSYEEGLILTNLLRTHHLVPVVVVTNSNDPELLKGSGRAGASAVETKQNLRPEAILALVERYSRMDAPGSGNDGARGP